MMTVALPWTPRRPIFEGTGIVIAHRTKVEGTMRSLARLSLVVLALAATVRPVTAQTVTRHQTVTPQELLARSIPSTPSAPRGSETSQWQRRVLTAVGGGAVGAFVGYFASQLTTGDWESSEQRESVNRPAWAAVGGSVGFAVGFSFPVSWGAPSGSVPPFPTVGRTVITEEDLSKLGLTNAYEAVEVLRPEWLNDRGVRRWGDTPDDGRFVYLDGTRIGNLSALRDLATTEIESIRLVDAGTATMRWGEGNSRGAILVLLKGGC